MKKIGTVAFFQGVGRSPEVQNELEDRLIKYDLGVLRFPTNWRDGESYKSNMYKTCQSIIDLALSGENIFLLATSAGTKPARSVSLRCHKYVKAAAYVCGKKGSFYMSGDPLEYSHPAIQTASDLTDQDLKTYPEYSEKSLWLRPETDERIDQDDITKLPVGAEEIVMKGVHGHVNGIEHGVTTYLWQVVSFYGRTSGILIPNEREETVQN